MWSAGLARLERQLLTLVEICQQMDQEQQALARRVEALEGRELGGTAQ